MTDKFEGWEQNQELWGSIEKILSRLSDNFDIEWNEDSFKAFYLTNTCYTENNNFCLEGSYSIIKKITYISDRNGVNRKRWEKQKQNIENSFRTIFPKFQLPEQSFRAVLNPLLNQTSNTILKMEDQKSIVFPLARACEVLGISLESKFSDIINFQFTINSKDTSLENPAKQGTNEIEDGNTATIYINIKVILKFPLEYCLFVINSKILSEILFFNYVNTQLQAYLGYNNYPNKQVNIIESQVYPFDITTNGSTPFKVSYPDGQIYYIQNPNLSYENYILETKKLYNPAKKELIGEISQLKSIQNKIILFDRITKQYIYTDSFGEIQRLDLSGYEDLSRERIKTILNFNTDSDIIKRFFNIVSSIYNRIDLSNKYDADKIFEEERVRGRKFSEITSANCPTVFKILNDCYNHWDSINFDILLKSKFKAYLSILLFENFDDEKGAIKELDLQATNISNSCFLPVELTRLLKSQSKNELINFTKCFRDSFFISKIGILLHNNKILKSAIITFEDSNVADRIRRLTDGNINTIILNRDTIRHLYQEFGNNLTSYFQKAPVNTVFIIHPNVFFESSILGNTDLYQANKLSFRSLITELLESIGLDYIVYYKQNILNTTDLVSLTIRNLFSKAKYRAIYGSIDYNDMLLIDPNCSVDTIKTSVDLKQNLTISKEEADKYGNIKEEFNSYLAYLPKYDLNTYIVEPTKIQIDYYNNLINLCYEKMINDEDFKQAVLASDLNNLDELKAIVSNFLSVVDIFLNAPDSDLFLFKEKFEQENNSNLISNKSELLYNILSAHLYGGVVEGIRKAAKNTSILIICENRVVRDHLYNDLSPRFYGNICYKFNSVSSDSLDAFRRKRIGFITSDLLNSYPNLSNISNYVIVQNSWIGNPIEDTFNYITYNSLLNNIQQSVEINYVLFNNSLELNKYFLNISGYISSQYKNSINSCLRLNDNVLRNLSDKILDFEKLDLYSWDRLKIFNLQEKIKYLQDAKFNYSKRVLDVLSSRLSEKLGFTFSQSDLYDIGFDSTKVDTKVTIGSSYYIPFINNLYLDFYNLIPAEVDEHFSDINGNAYCYFNGKLQLNMPVYTEYGTGYVTGESKDKYIVNVIGAKEFAINKDVIYKMQIPESERYLEYVKTISSFGDSLIDLSILQETVIKKKEKDLELDIPDNTVDLSIDRINGLFSIYTSAGDSDNVRLENFNFNHFSNTFILQVKEDILEDLYKFFRFNEFDADYIAVIKEAYKQWNQGSEFLLAPSYDYFTCEQIKTELPRAYPMILNKQFYILLNGNFYPKLGYKLSKKFNVSLIKNLFIQGFKDLKDCKYELLKISKTLNIANLQELLEFFDQDFLTLDYLKVSETGEEKAEENNKETLLKILKTKEAKLKKHIKDLRRNKYGQ